MDFTPIERFVLCNALVVLGAQADKGLGVDQLDGLTAALKRSVKQATAAGVRFTSAEGAVMIVELANRIAGDE